MGLDPVVECQSDHGCRQTRYDDLEPHDNFVQITVIVYKVLNPCKDLVVAWIGKIALAFRFAFAMKRPEIPEIDDDNRKDCTELDDNFKNILEISCHIQLNKLIYQNHVAGAADRKPLGNALYDTQQYNL